MARLSHVCECWVLLSDEFEANFDAHQGSVINPLLFIMVLEVLLGAQNWMPIRSTKCK